MHLRLAAAALLCTIGCTHGRGADPGAPADDMASSAPNAGDDGGTAGSGPDDLGTSGNGAGDLAPPTQPPVTEFAPYFYTWGWGSSSYAFSTLAGMKKLGGPSDVTLAFVLANNGACSPTTDIQSNLGDVDAFVAAGGHVKASFGGADGQYLENACTSAAALASAISSFVTATGITDLDFDIEQGSTSSNAAINKLRADALKSVQDSVHVRVAFTLPVTPDGLDSLGTAVVQAALDAGVAVQYVNVMTMDYGNGTDLGTTPSRSADATAKQLQGMVAGLSLAAAYRRVGVTAMIGHNDDSEVFSLDNANTLAAYAKAKQLGLVSFWAIQRDEKCAGAINLDTCNGVGTSTFQFSQIFATP